MRTIIAAVILFTASQGFAATYYVDPVNGSNANSGLSGSPVLDIATGIKKMAAGDTLVLEDGVYSGTVNMVGITSPRAFPPSGTGVANPTTIRARNTGGAVIDANYADMAFSNDFQSTLASYINVDGIHFRHGNGGVFSIKGQYCKVTNCGFEDGQSPTDTGQHPIAYITGGSDHVLFEDCWSWGKGRYGIYFQSSNGGVTNSIIRRCVVRQDDAAQGPTAGIMFYNSKGNSVQNCIVLDSRTSQSTSDTYGAFSMTANNGLGVGGNEIVASIGLNNVNYAGFFPQQSLATDADRLENVVLWGNGTSAYSNGSPNGLVVSSTDRGTYTADHITSGAGGGAGFNAYNSPGYGVLRATNAIAVNNATYGFKNVDFVDYACTFGNLFGASTGTTIGHGVTTNPIGSALKYLPRIEKGSNLNGAGNDGGDIGANVVYQVGSPGSFYGGTGWNVSTRTPLWPFPNEALWTAKVKSYAASGPGGNRGFAAVNSATPLTDYVWGYLGYPVPPFNLKVVVGSGSVTLSWDAATANANLTGYKVYVGTASGTYNYAGYEGGKPVGNVTSTVVSGLADGATYFFAVTAVDAINGESGYSYEVSTDMVPPVVTAFSLPTVVAGSLTVPLVFTATDNVSVTGYYVREDGATPAVSAAGWSASAPTGFTFGTAGVKTLYGWAKDGSGNVSARAEATVVFAGPANTDSVVTLVDVQKALYYYHHILTPTPEERRRCDVSPVDTATGKPVPDGNLGIDDVYVLLRKAVGLNWLPQ